MDPVESSIIKTGVSSSNSDNKRSSTQNSTINEQEQPSARRTGAFTRKRRSTQSNGDGSSSSTKQTFTTAINQILHRRASISSQRPKDLIAEINTSKIDNNKTRNTSPPSPISVNASIQQQNQPLPSHSTQHQPTLQRLLRKKSFRASRQFSPVSPLKPPFHYRQQFEEDPSREQKLLFHQTKDDKMEKLLKKAKIFLDIKQRPKARIASLWSVIDVANELDQAQFFQQNSGDVFDVVYSSFMSQVDKIKQKPDRSTPFTSKEFLNLNKILLLLRKIFLFLPDKIRVGWQRKQIAEILSVLLDHGNHPRVRKQGFQLLLLWINDQTIELDECMYLYSNAISLDLFLCDQMKNIGEESCNSKDNVWRKSHIPIALGQELIRGDHRGPLFPNPHSSTFNDAVNLIQVNVGNLVRLAHVAAGSIPPSENYEFPAIESIEPDNGIAIGMGIDAALAAAKFHFELIKKQYLVKIFPQCAKCLGLLPENQEDGFQKCPPAILRALITFFIHHCLDNHRMSDNISSYPSPATPILKSIVLGPENREFAHEIVRQSLMLPAGSPLYKDIVRGAVHIVGVWILSGEEERPAYLRKSLQNLPSPISQNDASTTPASTPLSASSFTSSYSDANVYLRRYIELLNLVFEDHSFLTIDGGMTNIEVEAQVSIYRDVLSLYRSIMTEGSIELELETWGTILRSLLNIQKRIMNQTDKYALIPSVALADDLADYLIETILYAFSRSKIPVPELWGELKVQMSFSTRWSQTMTQWAKIMLRLSKILSKHVHQVDLDQVELQKRLSVMPSSERHHHRRKPSKNRTKHLSLKHKSSGSTSSREDFDFSPSGLPKNESGKFGRRTLSMHSDTNPLDTKLLGVSGPNLLNISNRTSVSSIFFIQPNFSNEKLSMSLANFRSPDFINLDILPWTSETSLLVWRNMLCALGNLNHIQIIPHHAEAIKCLVDMLDMFGMVCYNQLGNVPFPLIYEFAPWLLEACDLPLAFAPGRVLAYGGLCKIMSFRHHNDFDDSYYHHFYRALLKGLSDYDNSIIYAIINNSAKLFSQCLPGINILYRSFIESIRNLLSKHNSKRVPEGTRQNAIIILYSLICIVNQVPSAKVPLVQYMKLAQINEFDESSFSLLSDVRFSEVGETLINSLSTETSIKHSETHNMLLYGICTFAFDELTTTRPGKTIIKECFQVLLDQLYWSHLPVVSAATDCLTTFAQNSSMWFEDEEIYGMILQDVFANLIGALNEHITIQKATVRNGRGTDLGQNVFDVIDLAFENRGVESLNYYKKVYPAPLRNQGKETSFRFKKSTRKVSLGMNHVVGVENNVEDENFVKEVAECILLHLTHHFNNFAPIYGPAMINSTLTGPLRTDTKEEDCAEHYQYFSFNDKTIITIIEIPDNDSSISRLIIRDITGRYAWDTKLFYLDDPYSNQNSIPKHCEITNCMELRPDIKIEPSSRNKSPDSNASPRSRLRNRTSNFFKDKNRLPVWTENSNNGHINMLDYLLQYVSEHTPLSKGTSDYGFQTGLSQLEKELDRHIQEEIHYLNSTGGQASSWYENNMSLRNSISQVIDNKSNGTKVSKRLTRNLLYSRSTSHLSLGADFSLSKSFLPVIPPEAEKPQEPYQQCRLFQSHFGWLNSDTFKEGSICVLNKGPALYRDIRLLDKKHSRESIKVGLLYVGTGQEDEQSILQNTSGSKEYEEFVTSLGWEIDLANHSGYLGGLEKNSTNGTTSIYYCTSTLEIIFHDVTRMPTDPTDPKQLRKKRHIGNDHVHIIWNEHYRDYRNSTIGGDFGNAQIIISPFSTNTGNQSTSLYAVDIYRDKIPSFGPLLSGMVISKNMLGPLILI
ncbi:8669_t:CDS:10 [Funneliformis caledonium]|uniref:8669_t:CDS:1 n=1 Tax=Funneliformis caledonium TaxID=1117310 RepID=A0A9N8ZNF0_9GLOM|nr:8669_t:CDS:10 [Funneliformis caledonium]